MSDSGWERSAEAWIEHVDTGDELRESTLDEVMLQELGDPRGTSVLDLGCGEGRFSRMLTKRGALVTGLEITSALVTEAKRRQPTGRFVCGSGTELPFRASQFDTLVTYIVLIDIHDHARVVEQALKTLRSGGRWIDSHVIPFRTSSVNPWHRDGSGKKLHVPVENYYPDQPIRAAWKGIDVVNYHRTLSSYWRPFLDQGLIMRRYLEPIPPVHKAANPYDLRVPLGMITVWEKP